MNKLAGTQRGPKRRILNTKASEVPSTMEWAAHLDKAGPVGGCRAEKEEESDEEYGP